MEVNNALSFDYYVENFFAKAFSHKIEDYQKKRPFFIKKILNKIHKNPSTTSIIT
jgi:hypothetical protein